MSVIWLVPAALAGLVLIALPIAIHLLVRQQSRRVDYPSLRFLRQSQLAAFRRRNIQDALLLACRIGIVAAAVLALAGPVFQTPSRTAGYADRTARAVILEPGVSNTAGLDEDAFASRSFSRDHLDDAIEEALRWLDEQPPAAREIVLVGTLRRGSVSRGQLDAIPPAVGIRFVPTPDSGSSRELASQVLKSVNGALGIHGRQVRLEDDETRVFGGGVSPVANDIVRVIAAPADQALADAALRAALGAGVQWSNPAARVLLVWPGVDEATVRASSEGASVVRIDRPLQVSQAASVVANAIESVTAPPRVGAEPVRISVEQLQAWSRAPGPVPSDAVPADEGDRRWLWAAALLLIVVEYALRRARSGQAIAESRVEARVA